MNYEGEIAGVVEKNNEKYLLLDAERPTQNSRKYYDRFISLIKIDKKAYKKLEKLYIKKALRKKKEIESKKKFMVKTQKILDSSFEIRADEGFLSILSSDLLNKFKDFYKKREGAKCLHSVSEQDVKKIEGLTSKNPVQVEATIEILGELRAKLSQLQEWKMILKENRIKIALIFPFYNEPEIVPNIRDVWDLVEEGIVKEIVIADGWSTDPSEEVVKNRLDAPITIVKNPGTGKGEALEGAIKYCFSQGFDFVICLDSDIIPPLHIIKGIPPLPLDITCDFFARSFISLLVKLIKKYGKTKALETYYKASYMRIPKSGVKLTPLRFGGTTIYVKKLYAKIGFKTMRNCVYPLSGEYAFNPKFLLTQLSVSKNLFDLYMKKYPGASLPSGFAIENFWNTLIEIKGLKVAFCNMFIHHHVPRGEKVKDKLAYASQRGTVFRGCFGAILQSMPEKEMKKYLKNFDFDLFRLPRPIIKVKIDKEKVKA